MRLLYRGVDGEIRLTDNLADDQVPPYAILSHTWGQASDEVTFEDMKSPNRSRILNRKKGYKKLEFCGNRATEDGFRYFWIDTCCINKSNNTELAEAINSMFRWYREAAVCYVYLSDVFRSKINDQINVAAAAFYPLPALGLLASLVPAEYRLLETSRWMTRSWTLQELLAPRKVLFFSREGKLLGDKQTLKDLLHGVTGIPKGALEGKTLSEYSVADRMAWAAKRSATKVEDKAYSLFGVFGVHLPLLYGEGEKNAFRRLKDEIAKSKGYKSAHRVARQSQRDIDMATSRVRALEQEQAAIAARRSWFSTLMIWVGAIFCALYLLEFLRNLKGTYLSIKYRRE